MFRMYSRIIANECIGENHWRLLLESPEIASEVKPGQFVTIRVSERNHPYFRRPFSVFQTVKLSDNSLGIEMIYKIVGKGTELLSRSRIGDRLDVMGPLGHGFVLDTGKKTNVLLAGGIGAAGLFMLGQRIVRATKGQAIKMHILLGASTKSHLVLEGGFRALGTELLIATDDGTYGYSGSVISMFKESIESGRIGSSDCAVYACGPQAMYKALFPVSQSHRIPAQIAMERHMMCGIGACVSCICYVRKEAVLKHRDLNSTSMLFVPEEAYGHALVCKDGPVFHIDEVILDE